MTKGKPLHLYGLERERIMSAPTGNTKDKSGTPEFVQKNAKWLYTIAFIGTALIFILARNGP